MIIECSNDWKSTVFAYIGDDYEQCLYIYSDLTKYGLHSQYVSTWVDVIDNSIRAIIMKYHNGMHIYSKNLDYSKVEIIDLIRETKPSMVLGVEALIKELSGFLDEYNCEYGYVKRMQKDADDQTYNNVKLAGLKDVAQLTDMLMSDQEFAASYTYEEMYGQISERISDGYGRTYYISCKNEICSQLGIAAEMEKFMVISNVYTAKVYRGRKYASKLFSYIKHFSEGKNIYLFCYGNALSQYYDRIGFETAQHWGKLFIKV